MTSYPGGLDAAPQTYTDFTGDPQSAPPTAILDADAVNLIFSALVAIETALGLTPQGTVGTGSGAATVAARLTAIDQAIAAGGVADGSIATAKLAAAAVTAAKLAAAAVGTAAIADGAVTAAKVAGDVATQAELDAVIAALGGKADASALSAYLTTAAASGSYGRLAGPNTWTGTQSFAGATVTGLAGSASPIDIVVGAPTGTNDHALINAAIATAKTAGQPARLIFSPGTYVCSSTLTNMDATSQITFVGGGGRFPRSFTPTGRTEIRYTGTGTGTFVSARDATGFTIEGLAVTYSSTSFTGILVDIGSVSAGPSYSPKLVDCYLGSTASTTKTATIVRVGGIVECLIEDTVISGGAIGIDGTHGSYANVVNMVGGRFEYCAIGVKNPLFQWTFVGVVWEPMDTTGISGSATGLTLDGCGFWDSVGGISWITLSGGNGLSISGGYWEPQSAETLVRITAATFDGLSITGLRGQHAASGSGTLLATAGASTLTNVLIAGNSLDSSIVEGLTAISPAPAVNAKRAVGQFSDRGSSGATLTLTMAATQKITLTAACALSIPTVQSGHEYRLRLHLVQDATGGRTVTWPASVLWPSGTAPTLTTTASKADVIELWTIDGGSVWNGRVLGQNYGTSVPVSLPSPVAVYDADLIGLANGAAVATWADTSGNSRDVTQATSGNRPTYVTGALNGKPVVRFAGGTQYLFSATTYTHSALFAAGTFSLIAVVVPTLSSSFASIAGMDGNQSNTNRLFQFRANWNAGSPVLEAVAFTASAASAATDSQAMTTGAGHVVSMVRDTSTVEGWVDGVSGGSTAIASVNTAGSSAIALGSGGVQAGAGNAVALGWVGDIAYVAIYPGVLTTPQRQSEEARLKALYGTP